MICHRPNPEFGRPRELELINQVVGVVSIGIQLEYLIPATGARLRVQTVLLELDIHLVLIMDVRTDSQAARCSLMEALSALGPAQDCIRCSIASHPTSVVHVVLRLRAGCWSTLCCHIICLGIAEVGGGALERFILAFLIVAALSAQSIPRWSEYSIGVALCR